MKRKAFRSAIAWFTLGPLASLLVASVWAAEAAKSERKMKAALVLMVSTDTTNEAGNLAGSVEILHPRFKGALYSFELKPNAIPNGVHGLHILNGTSCDDPALATLKHLGAPKSPSGPYQPGAPDGDLPNLIVLGGVGLPVHVVRAGAATGSGNILVVRKMADTYKGKGDARGGEIIACGAIKSPRPKKPA